MPPHWPSAAGVVASAEAGTARAALPSAPALPCAGEPRVRRHLPALARSVAALGGRESRSGNGPKQMRFSSQRQHLSFGQACAWRCGCARGCGLSFRCRRGRRHSCACRCSWVCLASFNGSMGQVGTTTRVVRPRLEGYSANRLRCLLCAGDWERLS